MPSEDYLRAAVAMTRSILAETEPGRVRRTTARCDSCGLVREGNLLHGSTCDRCETGRFVNVAKLRVGERPWVDGEDV